jgi:dTDP-4-dehydrorhamnose reductase
MTGVLVTGARGLLGSTLIPYLRARGHEVVTCSRSGANICADLTNAVQASAALRKASPEVIINLAALTNVDECERNPHQAYLNNVRIVENLARWMKEEGKSSHLIQISSDQVYDGTGPHRECEVTLVNYYGFSKYAGELAAASVSSTILRTNFFGRSECTGRISISDWLAAALTGGKYITVFEDVRFSPLSLTRLAQLVEIVVVKRQIGCFNLGSKDGMSKADFAFAVAAALELPISTMHRGQSNDSAGRARRPTDMCMDSSRFEAVFGVELPALNVEINSMKDAYVQATR